MAQSKKNETKEDKGVSEMTAAMMAMNPVAAKAWKEIMAEGTRFLTERLQKDFETQKAIMACKTPADLMQVQSEFFKTAMEQYSDEANRFYKMMTQAMDEAVEGARERYKTD